jgi:small subunit ribosomal protein S8
MSMTDPVADLLTRIRNGYQAKQDKIDVPASRLKANIVKVLRDEGFIRSFKLVREEGTAWIKIQLKYDDSGRAVVSGIRRISRPGLRRYVGHTDAARIKSGAGVAILSTSKGVMSGLKAKQENVGGEFLCEVW